MKPALQPAIIGDSEPPGTLGLADLGVFLTPPVHRHYSSNGRLSLLRSLRINIISNLQEACDLWQEFTPNDCLFDTWDFRLAFYRGYRHQPYFLLLKTAAENMALLPLWYETDKQKYFWFGSWWQEENKFLAKDQLFIPLLIAAAPQPLLLNALSVDLPAWVSKVIQFTPDDPKYILNLNSIGSVNDYLLSLKKKKRYNLKKDQQKIKAFSPQIFYNQFSDFNLLIKLAKERFAQKGEDTDWNDPRRIKTFREVIKLGSKNQDYQIRMISVIIGRQTAAVDLIALHNNCYYPLKCGYNVKDFPGIGNYMNLLEIQDALDLGMKKMDFLEVGYGWKDKWFQAVPLLQYEKNHL